MGDVYASRLARGHVCVERTSLLTFSSPAVGGHKGRQRVIESARAPVEENVNLFPRRKVREGLK